MVGGAGAGAAGADDRRAGTMARRALGSHHCVAGRRAARRPVRRGAGRGPARGAGPRAFAAAVPFLRDGATERDVQIELETAAFRAGGDAMAYDTIIGSGTNSAVLHFAPSARVLRSGELVLIDAGAEYRCYASDVTRTYPVDGRFGSEQQAELHGVLERANSLGLVLVNLRLIADDP